MALVLLRAATGSVACPQAPWPPQTLPCGKTLGKRCKRQLFIVATVVRLRMLIGSNQLVWLMVVKDPPTRPFWVAKHQVSAWSSHKCPEPMFSLYCRTIEWSLRGPIGTTRSYTSNVAVPRSCAAEALHLLAATQNSVECIGSLLQGLPQLKAPNHCGEISFKIWFLPVSKQGNGNSPIV